MSYWFYLVGDQQNGPFSEEELAVRKQRGEISNETLLWCNGMGDWESLAAVFPEPEAGVPSKPVARGARKPIARGAKAVVEPEPIVAEPEPIVAEPEPIVAEPEPIVAEPESIVAEPEPIVAEPKVEAKSDSIALDSIVEAKVVSPKAGTAVCAVSGVQRPISEMVQYGNQYVSREHKDKFAQSLTEGVQTGGVEGVVEGYETGGVYKDPKVLALLTKICFIVGTITAVIGLGLNLMVSPSFQELSFLTLPVAILFTVFFAFGMIFFFGWKFRCAKNCRVLSNKSFKISPFWAVGFYFVPIAFLWKPYQAMCEIWRVSFNDGRGRNLVAIKRWWKYWIISNTLGLLLLGLNALELIDRWTKIGLYIGYSLAAIAVLFPILTIIRKITKIQQQRARKKGLV